VTDDPDHDYEIVAGSRRHRVISRLRAAGRDMLLKAIVLDCSDEEAALAADAENRGRSPISAYERARFLRARLPHYGSQAELASAYRLDRALLNRLLMLAEWPDWLLSAWPDPRDISAYDAGIISPRLRKTTTRGALEAAACSLAEEQRRRREQSQPLLSTTEVRRRLLDATSPRPALRELRRVNGDVVLVVRSQTREGMLLYVSVGDATLQEQIIGKLHILLNQALHDRDLDRPDGE
jgi:ParB family chromosome partitioning protein